MKNKKGITLIALIITIIVLLILAGVSISIVTGDNGLLSQAQDSKVKTDKAHIQEMKDLTSARAAMNLEGYTDEKTGVYIPSGFAVSENPDEQTIEKGLVIIDKMGDEFVWIPVETNGSDFKRKISSNWRIKSGVDNGTDSNGGNSEIASLRDDFGENKLLKGTTSGEEATDIELNTVKNAKGFFVSRYEIGLDGTEQRTLTGVSDIGYYSKIGVGNDYVYTDAEKALYWSQADDDQKRAIIDRILPQLQSKQGVEPVRRMTQDECLWLANEWKSGKDYQSGLMTGRTWDRMVSWICDDTSEAAFSVALANSDSSSWGNYGWSTKSTTYKSIFTSGDANGKWIKQGPNFSRDKIDGTQRYVFPTGEFISNAGIDTSKKNVYDVAGNVWEWTTEESHYSGSEPNWNNRVLRGGGAYHDGIDHTASRRAGGTSGTTSSQWDVGFRCVLYVTK